MRQNHFYILLSLADRERHGSGIMRDVLALTDGAVKLWPVALYGSLDELVDEGLIRSLAQAPAEAEEAGPGHRRWFRITAAGRRALTRETAAMASVVQQAHRRLARAES